MAGTKTGKFKELVSPYLKDLMSKYKSEKGEDSPEYQSLYQQYYYVEKESKVTNTERLRHYESTIDVEFEGEKVVGVERLYRRTILLEPTTVCAAHCRWCLRGQYPVQTLNRDQITLATKYMGSSFIKKDVNEVLITGGDPLMAYGLLEFCLSQIQIHAPNIKTVRFGTRVPLQDPARVNDKLLDILSKYDELDFEFGINTCHYAEFTPQSEEAITKLIKAGYRVYNQHPLLKNVNDNAETLIKLYDKMRELKVEGHYLFHAIPMRGMSHHRTSVERGLKLSMELSSSGYFSGRTKPRFCLMTDLGKVVLYEGSILKKDEDGKNLLIKTSYNIKDREKWVPGWKKPESVEVNPDNTMNVWYENGSDI
tara:strand:+ start:2995 stop:4095 length:1101 start_codon:yes stop_codon:yes gene_type:complete